MTGYLKAWSALIALTLGGLACVARVEAAEAKDPETVFEEADNAFVEGNFTLGEQLLNELIASHPGDLELATRALHRLCLSEYLELMDNDWPSTGYPQHLFNVSGRDSDKMWELISEYLQEGFLIAGKFAEDGERYHVDPRKNPFLLESLWRIVTNFPLSPLENISDEAPARIMALRRSGYLDANDPAVIDASTLLVFLRPSQKRYLEAAQLVDDLVTAKNQQIDWLLARARFHATIRSPRAATLFRDLFVKFEKQGVDPIIAKAARRAEFFNIPDIGPATELAHAGQGWIGQLIHEEENRAWGRLATGLVDGLEEQIDLWIQGTFGNEQSQVYMLRKDETGSAMKWNVLDVQLKSLGAGALLELRKLQEERCRIDPRASDWDKATQTEKLALFRRFPWAKTAHRGLMAYAKKELEAGRSQSARRGFRDVLEHTDDPDLHNRAQVGIWLATAQGQDYGELAKLFGAADQDDTFPWMGKRATAREIKERLMQGVVLPPAKNEAPPLSDLGVQFLKLPARPLWPQMKHRRSPGLEFVDLQSVGSNLLVSTRNLLAWYEAKNGNEPVWADTCRSGQGSSIGRLGRFRPIIKEDRIYTRWGYGADPGKLVAMDAGTRDILWSLDVTGPAKARRRIPLGNPVLSGDQIYLAAAWDEHRSTGGYNLRLSSVDAATGKVNWLTDLYIQAMQHFFEGVLGESLTIHDGAIYCSPSTGFLGRFDARDGKMEWMYNYESVDRTHLPVDTLGTAPHIVGDVVVGLPRDTNVMVGLDQRTGEVLWRSSLLLPTEIIGSVEGKVVVRGLYALAAIDAKTGEIQWRISHPDKILGQPTLQGSSIYLTSGDNLYRYDAATGIEQETRSLPKAKNTIRNAKTLHDNLYLITDEPSVEKEYSLVQKAPGDSVWEIMARDPKLYVPKGNESSQGKILIHADEMLHCLEATPAGKVLWQRFVYLPQDVFFVEGKVVLLYHKNRFDLYLKALDQKTGNLEWDLTLLRLRCGHGSIFGRAGKYLYGRDNSDRFQLVDLTSGKVVLKNRIKRRNGHVKAGFGGGKVQFFVTPAYRSTLHWLRWDIASGELEGSDQVLKGRDGDPNKAFDNNWIEFAKFGSHTCYFISRQEGSGREYVAYRADYKDRSVHLVGKNTKTLKFEPPFLFMQQEESDQNKKDRTHPWAIQREDDPKYNYSLDLPHEWYHRPTFVNGHVLDVRSPRNKQPWTVRVHDLGSKKALFTQTSENTERMGGIPAGPNRILVYDWKRNVRNTPPHFKLTLYDLNTGLAGQTMEIDYWSSNNQTPNEIRVAGNLVLINDRNSVKAWQLKL